MTADRHSMDKACVEDSTALPLPFNPGWQPPCYSSPGLPTQPCQWPLILSCNTPGSLTLGYLCSSANAPHSCPVTPNASSLAEVGQLGWQSQVQPFWGDIATTISTCPGHEAALLHLHFLLSQHWTLHTALPMSLAPAQQQLLPFQC